MENMNETFNYTYSAQQQAEIKKIREKYQPCEEDKMEQLRNLDASVTRKGTVCALSVGVVSALVMGSGMSLVMTDLGESIGVDNPFVLGIVIGIIGLAGMLLTYPLYVRVTKKERERITPEIIRLTDELMK